MKPEETIDFHIRWAWHGIARMYNLEASKYDSSMAVGQTLLSIDIKEGTPSTKLGPKMGMEPRSLTRMLKSMEERGLIYRKVDKTDKRMVRIYLTKAGAKHRDISRDTVIRFNLALQEKLSPTKLKGFFKTIKQINELLNNQNLLNGKSKSNSKK
ncbi:MAG: MarR family transcriptional regulator [Bacteroidetes bacterium]|nr:MAG: MarR family transcriptional regulator [Bacteroidota bacterium]